MAEARANLNIGANTTEAVAAIKNLQRQISTFYTSISKGSAASQAAVGGLQKNLINSINATGQFSARVQTISTTTESFTNALEKNKLTMGQYFRYAGAASGRFGRKFTTEINTIDKVARERVKDLQTQYIQLGRDANGAMKAIAVRPATLDLNNFSTQTQIAAQKQAIFNQLIQQGSTNLLNWGKNTQWAGRQLMVGFTIPLTIFATTAGRAFMQLEEQAIKFKRVYGDLFTTGAQTDQALAEMRALGDEFTKFGVAVEETVGLAATVAQMGKTGADLTAQVTEATRLSVLGGMSQEQALDTTIGLTNAFGVSVEDLTNKVNFLNAAENQTILSIQDFNEAVPRAGSVVSQLGGDVEDLAFFMASMREGGIEASQAANALKSSLGRLINPTQRARDRLKEYGIDVTGIVERNTGDLRGTVMELAYALDELEPLEKARAIEQLFGKFQFARMSTLFQNIIKDGSQASTILDLINSSASDLSTIAGRELGRVEESAATKFTAALERFQAALAPIGAEFLKLATPILEFGTKLLENFNNLGDGTKKAVTMIIGAIGGIMPVALMAIGLTANLIANIIKGLNRVRLFFQRFKGQAQDIATQTDYLTQQQIESQAVSASLEQSHQRLSQSFNVEADALNRLTQAYERAIAKQRAFRGDIVTTTGMAAYGNARTVRPQGFNDGVVSVPGVGNRDTVPAMLTPGEAVIPKEMAKRYAPIINAMVSGNVPGYMSGTAGAASNVAATIANRAQATGNQVAAHGYETTGENLPATLQNLTQINREFGKMKVVVWQLTEATDLATRQTRVYKTAVEMTVEELAEASQGQYLYAGGATYPGTAVLGSPQRNAAINDLGVAGDPRLLDNLIDVSAAQGGPAGDGSDLLTAARQAQAENTAAYQRHTAEIDQIIAEGELYEQAIRGGANAEQVRADYAREQNKQYLIEADMSRNKISREQATRNAEERLLAIDRQEIPLREKELLYLQETLAIEEGQHFTMGTRRTSNFTSGVGSDQTRSINRGSGGIKRGGTRPLYYQSGASNEVTGMRNPPGLMRPGQLQAALYPSSEQYVASITDAFAKNVNRWSQSASPSKKTERSAKNLVDGFLVALRNASDDMQNAGAQLGQAAVSGMVSQGGHNVPLLTPDYISSRAPAPAPVGAGLPMVGQTSIWMPGVKENLNKSFGDLSTSNSNVANSQQKVADSADDTTKKTKNFGGGIMGASFALTGLVGAASMFDNKLGEFAQKLMPFTGAVSGATVALLMLRDTAIGAAVAQRLSNARTAAGTTAVSGFGRKLLRGTKVFARFFGVAGLVITGLAAAGGGIYALIKANEEAKKRQRGLSDAVNATSDKVVKFGEALGQETRRGTFDDGINFGDAPIAPEDRGAVREAVDAFGGAEEFEEQFEDDLNRLREAGARGSEYVEDFFSSVAARLALRGWDAPSIQTFIDALRAFSGVDVTFNVESSGFFDEEGNFDVEAITNRGKAAAESYTQAYDEEVANWQPTPFPEFGLQLGTGAGPGSTYSAATLEQAEEILTAQQEMVDARAQMLAEAGRDPEQDFDYQQMVADLEQMKQAIAPFREFQPSEALQMAETEQIKFAEEEISALNAALEAGAINNVEFADGIAAIFNNLGELGLEAKGTQEVLDELGVEGDRIDSLKDTEARIAAITAIGAGLNLDDFFAGLSSENAAERAAAINSIATAIEQVAIAKEKDASATALQQVTTDIENETAAVQAQIDMYNNLIGAGVNAEIAYKLISDSAFMAAAAQMTAAEATQLAAGEIPANLDELIKAAQERFDTLQEFSGIKPGGAAGGGGQVETSAFDQITASLRKFADAQVKVTSGFEDTIAEIENFINVSGALTGEFGGLNQELRGLGLNENLIEMIVGMDPDEYEKRKNDLFIFDDRGTIIGMTSKLQGLNQALNTAVIGEFVNEQNNITVSVGHQVVALQRLTAAGASYQAAYRAVQNTALAAAISTAKSSAQIQAAAEAAMRAQEMMDEFEEINEEELRRERIRDAIVEQNREFSNQAKILNYITRNTNRLSEAQKEAILGDKDLQALILEPGIAPGALQTALDNANRREELELEIKKLTITGQQEIWEDGLSKAMEAFSAQEQEIELKFQADTAADQKIADAAAEEIEKLQFQLDDYEAGIEEIENQEDLINEVYDKRIESLEDIEDANERITRQQEAQLNIAEALSRGDIAAAAQAAQEARSLAAENAAEDREARLERARQAELGRARSRSGMGREELQTAIRGIEQQIFRIEEDRLEPAEEAIRLADVRKEADIEALTVLGKTKTEWEEIGNRIDLAVVNNYKFVDAMQEALDIVEELVANLQKPKSLLDPILFNVGGGGSGESKTKNAQTMQEASGGGGSVPITVTEAARQLKSVVDKTAEAYASGGRPSKELIEENRKLSKQFADLTGGTSIRAIENAYATALNSINIQTNTQANNERLRQLEEQAAATRARVAASQSSRGPGDRGDDDSRSSSRERTTADRAKDVRQAQSISVATRGQVSARDALSIIAKDRAMANRRFAMGGFVRRAMPGPPSQSAGYAGGGFVRNRVSTPPQMYYGGGKVAGPGTSISDSIPALLSDGEYVINAKAVERIGVPNLDRLNNQSGKFFQQMKDGVLAFASGGRVSIRSIEKSAPERIAAAKKSRPTIRSVEKSAPEKIASSRSSSSSREQRDNSREGGRSRRQEEAARKQQQARLLELKRERERQKALDNIRSSVSSASSYGPLQARAMESKQSSNWFFKPMTSAVETEQVFKSAGEWFASTAVGQGIGKAITSEGVGGTVARGVIAALSTPADIIGGIVEGGIRSINEKSITPLLTGGFRGIGNAFSGVLDPSKMQDGMFTKAGQYVADNRMFGATNAEAQARARLIGGGLNILGDPLTYVGIGLGAKAAKTSVTAARTRNVTNPLSGVTNAVSQAREGLAFLKTVKPPTNEKSAIGRPLNQYIPGLPPTRLQLAMDAGAEEVATQLDNIKLNQIVANYARSNNIDSSAALTRLNQDRNTFSKMVSDADLSLKGITDMAANDYSPNYLINNLRDIDKLINDPNFSAQTIQDLAQQARNVESFRTSPLLAPIRTYDKVLANIRRSRMANQAGFTSLPYSRTYQAITDLMPANARALMFQMTARHRSSSTDDLSDLANILHPRDVPISAGRAQGAGTYFAQTKELSDKIFSNFGPQKYRQNMNLANIKSTLGSKGYIKTQELRERGINLEGVEFDSPEIQKLIKEGYIGVQDRDAIIDWRIGATPGIGLKKAKELSGLQRLIYNGYVVKDRAYRGVEYLKYLGQKSSDMFSVGLNRLKALASGAGSNIEEGVLKLASDLRLIDDNPALAGILPKQIFRDPATGSEYIAKSMMARDYLSDRMSDKYNIEAASSEFMAGQLGPTIGANVPESLLIAQSKLVSRGIEETAVASKVIPNAMNVTPSNLHDLILRSSDKPDMIIKLFEELNDYVENTAGINALLKNEDIHAGQILWDNVNQKFQHIDFDASRPSKNILSDTPDSIVRSTWTKAGSTLKSNILKAVQDATAPGMGTLNRQEQLFVIDKLEAMGFSFNASPSSFPLSSIQNFSGSANPKPFLEKASNALSSQNFIQKATEELSNKGIRDDLLDPRLQDAILDRTNMLLSEFGNGNSVKFAMGGRVLGSDMIPAMLTRGEYVIKRPAVESFGADNLEKINNGTYADGSVYNYNLSVNVKSDSNPDQIARTVMDQIKRVDSQRIRGNRF